MDTGLPHVIIGNGPAGVVAAETLRRVDPHSEITLIGDEAEPPYSRMAIPYLLMGRIGEEGNPREMFVAPKTERLAEFLKSSRFN